jgi:hypothetical protein
MGRQLFSAAGFAHSRITTDITLKWRAVSRPSEVGACSSRFSAVGNRHSVRPCFVSLYTSLRHNRPQLYLAAFSRPGIALSCPFSAVAVCGKCLSNIWRRGPESNRRIEVLQTSALPLGYRAVPQEPRTLWQKKPPRKRQSREGDGANRPRDGAPYGLSFCIGTSQLDESRSEATKRRSLASELPTTRLGRCRSQASFLQCAVRGAVARERASYD